MITGLNIATSVQVGNGSIWVLNPPYLLRYPDANHDDLPDGDPEVHLSGFGLQDTHATANSLLWGLMDGFMAEPGVPPPVTSVQRPPRVFDFRVSVFGVTIPPPRFLKFTPREAETHSALISIRKARSSREPMVARPEVTTFRKVVTSSRTGGNTDRLPILMRLAFFRTCSSKVTNAGSRKRFAFTKAGCFRRNMKGRLSLRIRYTTWFGSANVSPMVRPIGRWTPELDRQRRSMVPASLFRCGPRWRGLSRRLV